ncbi:hypothetical protein B0O99DRAFT_126057 [Bisporella sp. PMI_857]|nr:hypothetical protein B0O99DRAFT_126057 [Bisporella sp. PMI_857]
MAELIGLGASVLSIAALGASIVTRLRTFSSSYSGADQNIADLTADIALTASILTEIGHTFEEYEKEFHLKADNFVRAKATCEKNFERLEKALRQARKSEIADFTILGKKLLTGQQQPMRPWEKLKYALGGDQELKELVMSNIC